MGKRNGVRCGGSVAEKMAGPLESLETGGRGNEIGRGGQHWVESIYTSIGRRNSGTRWTYSIRSSLSDSSCITTSLSLGIRTFLIISSDAFPAFSGVILRGFSFFI